MKLTTEQQIMQILHEDYPEAQPEQSFADIGMDSLEYIAFLDRIEDHFGIVLKRDETPVSARELGNTVGIV